MTKLNQESGRSMVEMLGVLAIIGVLSIGGIAGYTMAMNRYKANELLNAASMLNVIALSQNITSGKSYANLVDNHAVAGVDASKITITEADTITVDTGSADICQTMRNIAGENRVECADGTATIDFSTSTSAS